VIVTPTDSIQSQLTKRVPFAVAWVEFKIFGQREIQF
jgi:hypothetical protein